MADAGNPGAWGVHLYALISTPTGTGNSGARGARGGEQDDV